MAQSTSAASRLPDLHKCLTGDEVVLAWEDVLNATLSHHEPPSTLHRQFYAANSAILSQIPPTFGSPNGNSRSRIDKVTSDVAALSESQRKEAEQIKSDALWLSDLVKLEEVEALRTTLVEWQNRPELRLNAGFADAELASLRDALGSEYAQTLELVPAGPYSRSDADFDSADARKVRILHTFYRSQVAMLALAREELQSTITMSESHGPQAQWQSLFAHAPDCTLQDAVVTTTSAISGILQELGDSREWKGIDPRYAEQLEISFVTSKLQSTALLLEILLLRTHTSKETVTGEVLQEWLTFAAGYDHFAQLQSDVPVHQAAIERIQFNACYIGLALINPAFSMEFLDSPAIMEAQPGQTGTHFFLDADKIEILFEPVMVAAEAATACASPAVLAWGLIFYKMKVMAAAAKHERESRQVQKAIDRAHATEAQSRRWSSSSFGSTTESILEQVIGHIRPLSGGEDPLEYMLESAVRGGNVFEVASTMAASARNSSSLLGSFQLNILQSLLAAARPALGYTPDLFNAQLAILSSAGDSAIEQGPFKLLVNFIGDEFLRDNFLDVAASRFPYETLPFLRITILLAKARNHSLFRDDGVHYITHRLQTMESFTQAAIGGFESYHTTQEDENANLVALDHSVGMLDHRSTRRLTSGTRQEAAEIVPGGAVGEVISESMPPVIRWHHTYSGIALLGKWLELHVKGELANIVSPFETANDVAAAAVGLLSVLLRTTYDHANEHRTQDDARQLCQDLLEEASVFHETGRDIVDCVFDLVEQQLVSTRRFSPASGCDLLSACVDFITILCRVRPFQLWPLLVKSSVVAAYGAKRSVFAVIASVEVPIQSFLLLESCSMLLQATVDLVLTVSMYSDVARGLKSRAATTQRPLATAVLGLTQSMYAAFDASAGWTFVRPKQKQTILDNICAAFSSLLYYSFGTGNSCSTDSSITVCFRPAANFLLEALSGTGVQSLGSGPVALHLVSAAMAHAPDVFTSSDHSYLRSLLSLARIHLGCSRLSGHALKQVNATLVNLFPVLIRLPVLYAPLLRPCLALECDIFDAFDAGSTPHLLGHLGSLSCLSFLDSLRYLNARAHDEVHISWRLIARLITLDQQWTAVVLITGSPPGRERKESETPKLRTRGKPLLEQALDKLVRIDSIDPTVAVALLMLLSDAQQSWPSVADAIAARTDLFPALISHATSRTSYDHSDLSQALHNQVAAGVVDLSIISLHAMMAFRDEKRFAVFIPFLEWLTKNACEVNGYNSSLHANLKKNFAMKYDDLDVSVVKRTGILRIPYGESYFYDLDFADKILYTDRHWNNGPQSFHAELCRANINLSVVDSELILLRSFTYLCSEHGSFFAKHKDVQIIMSHMVSICLRANCKPSPPESLFDSLFQSRAEIAAMVLGPLVTVGARGSDYTTLLRLAYDTARYSNGSYELAIMNNDLQYWRSMLTVVRLSMQFHVTKSRKTVNLGDKVSLDAIDPSNTLFCEIGAHIVGEGLRSLVAALQDQRQRSKDRINDGSVVDASDVLLLLNVLQTMLRLPSLPQFANQLADALISTSTPQTCLLLFSWSHLLDETPVYAVLASRFLAAISKLGPVAEELAVEGVLNRILISKMTQRIQQMPQGVGHLDRRPNAGTLYNIWSDGFLRICLNLLDAIGGGVAAEVANFINAFPEQVSRASLSFSTNPNRAEGTEGLTLGAACELANLALLSFVLERFRIAGASSAVDPTQIAPLAGFDEHKKGIAADIRDVIEQDLRFRLKREVPTNETQAAWAKKSSRPEEKGGRNDQPRSSVLDQKMIKELKDARRCLLPEGEEQ
ncbi:uncharacterized protein HMPREF1541_11066 [Cyphellophora europaea CBS 101466]|uniref:Uncharacterized protein n=1 Tax=Cyphellophora europaea (strain CBS 101466) TaxID=1220924 RepID=W2S5Q8_CYPE1|nr:uncharacterized protein HMPREF1541_11066 [Cyphellophora europaea CBS 101466]ETN43935.1 hypothetical protein HMPREF1541_11066 [Cyphellophora europaea CBS 101466]